MPGFLMDDLITISSKGQLVIPKPIRRELGLEKGGKVRVQLDGRRIVLEPLETAKREWRTWEGVLEGTSSLEDLLLEHRREIEAEKQ